MRQKFSHSKRFKFLAFQIQSKVHIAMTHDWPKNIVNRGNAEHLLRFKPYFEEDIRSGKFGSKAGEILLNEFKPDYFFSAHFHVIWRLPYDFGEMSNKFSHTKKLLCIFNGFFETYVVILANDCYYNVRWLNFVFKSHF